MPGPKTGDCGHPGEPACPPVPTVVINGVSYYTVDEMHDEINKAYRKGGVDQRMIPHPGDN